MVTYNAVDMTMATLESLYACTPKDSFKLYLVDNNSTDDTREQVTGQYPDIELIASNANLGFGGGNNLALEKILASGEYEYVGLINNDMFFTPGWLEAMVSELSQYPKVAALNPLILYADKFHKLDLKLSNPEVYLSAVDYRFMAQVVGADDSKSKEQIWENVSYVQPGRKDFPVWIAEGLQELELKVYDEKLSGYRIDLDGKSVGQNKLSALLRKIAYKLTGDLDLKIRSFKFNPPTLSMQPEVYSIINSFGTILLPSGYPVNLYYGQTPDAIVNPRVMTHMFYGACALIRVEALRKAGLFDPEYFLYFEESDLSIRMTIAGYEFMSTTAATVYHREKGSRSEKTLGYIRASEKIYFRKWGAYFKDRQAGKSASANVDLQGLAHS